jgi:hypothetical protein
MSTNNAPFTVIPRLTQIAMAIKPSGMIADQVLPRVPVEGEKFNYTKMATDEAFTIPDTRVGRSSAPNQVEFGGTDVTESTEDYGLDDFVPNKDVKNAEGTNYDPIAAATERTALLVQLAREQRVSNLVFTLATYAAALRTTLAGADQWSDPAGSDPVKAVLTAFDAMLVRPNIAVFGQQVWTAFRQHPKVVAATKGSFSDKASGVAARQAVAELLELEDVYVGQAFYQTAKKGQAAAYSRLWGKHAAFLKIERHVRDPRHTLPCFGFTAQWGTQIAGTIPNQVRGLLGGQLVRVGEQLKELVAFQEAGYFFQNAVA